MSLFRHNFPPSCSLLIPPPHFPPSLPPSLPPPHIPSLLFLPSTFDLALVPEQRVITAIGSLILDRPLTRAYAAGTTVTVTQPTSGQTTMSPITNNNSSSGNSYGPIASAAGAGAGGGVAVDGGGAGVNTRTPYEPHSTPINHENNNNDNDATTWVQDPDISSSSSTLGLLPYSRKQQVVPIHIRLDLELEVLN